MALTLDRGQSYFVMNVAKHLFGKVLWRAGQPVQQALRTTDLSVAKLKAFELEGLKRSKWRLREMGEEALAHEKFAAAKRMAESRGFTPTPPFCPLASPRSMELCIPRLVPKGVHFALKGEYAQTLSPAQIKRDGCLTPLFSNTNLAFL